MQTGKPVTIFGDDYATPDGTCIRDYIHVNDLAQAHILAVEYLLNGGASDQFNVGTGTGNSVLEMIRTVEEVTGKPVPYVVGPRREGDPPALVAAVKNSATAWAGRRNTPTCGPSSRTPGTSPTAARELNSPAGASSDCSRTLRGLSGSFRG